MIDIIELISAFFMSFFFGIFFQNPKRTLIPAGLTGAMGWLGYSLTIVSQSELFAVLIGSLIIGVLGELFARVYKTPVTLFVVVGFIPLVPGSKAYNTIIHLTRGEYIQGIELGLDTVFIACAIALGISIVSSVARLIKETSKETQASNES